MRKKLEVIPGATHLFEEHGAMEQVCETAMKWFQNFKQQLFLNEIFYKQRISYVF